MTFRKVTPAALKVNVKKFWQVLLVPWHVWAPIWVHFAPWWSIFTVKNRFSHIFPAPGGSPFLTVILTVKLARLGEWPIQVWEEGQWGKPENDEGKNCCTRIYHHGPADRHRGFGKERSCRRNINRIYQIFRSLFFVLPKCSHSQMRKNTWVPPSSDPNGQVQSLLDGQKCS